MMRWNMKCILSTLLVLTLLGTLITGCSGSKSDSKNEESAVQATAHPDGSTQPVKLQLVARKLGEALAENPIKPMLEQKVGVILDINWRAPSDYGQQCQVILASGDFPDMMEVWWTNPPGDFDDFAKSGQIIAVDDLVAKYGPDIVKARPPQSWWKAADGKTYGIPCRYAEMVDDTVLIRQDWLDNLSLKAPTNLDELYSVAKAFTSNDPDKNGKQDTVGIGQGKDYLGSWAISYAAHGVALGQWNVVNGNLVWWGVRPEALEAAKFYRKLYQEGLVEPEFPILGRSEVLKKMNQNKYGIFSYQPTQMTESTSDQWREFRNSVPDAKISVLKPVVKPGVDKPTYGGVAELQFINQIIFKKAKNPEKCVQLLNFLATDEGTELAAFGIKGQTWNDNNGKFEAKSISPDEMKASGAGLYSWMFRQKYYLRNTSDLARTAAETYVPYITRNPMPYATAAEQKYGPTLKGDLTGSTFSKIIVEKNSDPDKLWQEYVSKWNSGGGKEMTEAVNAEYQKMKGKK